MSRFLKVSALGLLSALTTPAAMAQDASVSVSVDYVTEYVFRGVSLASDAIQPGVELNVGGFTAGVWASTGLGDNSEIAADEVDFYVSYDADLSDVVSYSVGLTYYHYPQGGGLFETDGGGTGSYEMSAGLGFDTPLAPSITGYYDFTLESFTLEGSLGHSIPAGESGSFDLGVTAGHVDFDGGDYQYGTASASYAYSFTDDVGAYIGINYTLNSEDNTLGFSEGTLPTGEQFAFLDGDDLFWGGIGISAGF